MVGRVEVRSDFFMFGVIFLIYFFGLFITKGYRDNINLRNTKIY